MRTSRLERERPRPIKLGKVAAPSLSRPCQKHSDCGCRGAADCCLRCPLTVCTLEAEG